MAKTPEDFVNEPGTCARKYEKVRKLAVDSTPFQLVRSTSCMSFDAKTVKSRRATEGHFFMIRSSTHVVLVLEAGQKMIQDQFKILSEDHIICGLHMDYIWIT